jgi:hypothetical protein
LSEKCGPHPEHQENDADLGELIGELLVGDKARRCRPDQDTGGEVADQRRELEPMGDRAERPG